MQRAEEELEALQQAHEESVGGEGGRQQQSGKGSSSGDLSPEEQKHEHQVAGGYKATLKNPRVSDEAKQHAQEKLNEMGY